MNGKRVGMGEVGTGELGDGFKSKGQPQNRTRILPPTVHPDLSEFLAVGAGWAGLGLLEAS